MKENTDDYIQLEMHNTDEKEDRKRKAKKDYKENKCDSIQVFLEKCLVQEFKQKVKQNGHSQAGVIRGFVQSYLNR